MQERMSGREDDARRRSGDEESAGSRSERGGETSRSESARRASRREDESMERRNEGVQTSMGRSMMPYRSDELGNWPFAFQNFGGPFDMMRRISQDFDRMFDEMLGTGGGRGRNTMFMPRAEVFRKGDQTVVRLELPGMGPEDVHVRVENDHLIVEGERRMDDERGEGNLRSEMMYGRFFRMIPLPSSVSEDQVKARFRNGVLEITIPQPEGRTPAREIPIEG